MGSRSSWRRPPAIPRYLAVVCVLDSTRRGGFLHSPECMTNETACVWSPPVPMCLVHAPRPSFEPLREVLVRPVHQRAWRMG